MERTALALMLCLVGCGGAAATSQGEATEPTPAERRLHGCQARYLAEHDTTMVYLVLPNDYLAGVGLPGDGWDGGCGRSNEIMLEAVRERDGMFVVAGYEPGATAPADLNVFAREQASLITSRLAQEGHTVVHEQITPRTESMFSYALMTEHEGLRLMQYHTDRFDPFPAGLFRVHFAYVAQDVDTVETVAPSMLEAAYRSRTIARSELSRSGD